MFTSQTILIEKESLEMPIYYFHYLENGEEKSHDTTGDQWSDHHAAHIKARRAMAEYLMDVVANDGPD